MQKAEKKYRLIYFDEVEKQFKVKECASRAEVSTWQIGNPSAKFIEFFAVVGPDQVVCDTLEEAIAKAGDASLVKPKIPKDLPQEAREVLYKL